jgi:hypothetical protein
MDEETRRLLRQIGAVPVNQERESARVNLDRIMRLRDAPSLWEAIAIAREDWHQQMHFTVADDDFAPAMRRGDRAFIDPTLPLAAGNLVAAIVDGRLVARELGGEPDHWELLVGDDRRAPIEPDTAILGTLIFIRRSLDGCAG